MVSIYRRYPELEAAMPYVTWRQGTVLRIISIVLRKQTDTKRKPPHCRTCLQPRLTVCDTTSRYDKQWFTLDRSRNLEYFESLSKILFEEHRSIFQLQPAIMESDNPSTTFSSRNPDMPGPSNSTAERSRVYFDIQINKKKEGRVTFELVRTTSI